MKLPAKREQKLAIEIPEEFRDIFSLAKNMEGVVPRLPQIKIGHSVGVFEMPDGEVPKEIEGIIIDQHAANAWWQKDQSEGDGNALPDCFSKDGVTPQLDLELVQATECEGCIQNEYGSAKKGKGKACKNMKRLHIIQGDSMLPRRFTVPPSSIANADIYLSSLVDRGLPYMAVVTKFSLKKKEAGGNVYSEVLFSRDRVITQEEIPTVASFIKTYNESARKQDIHSDEYGATTSEEENVNGSNVPDSDIPF